MAEKKGIRDSVINIFGKKSDIKPIITNSQIERSKKDILDLNRDVDIAVYGSDANFETETREDLKKVRKISSVINNQFSRSSGGADITDLLTKVNYFNNRKDRDDRKEKFIDGKQKLDIFNEADAGIINEIFVSERDRIGLYGDYGSLFECIPQLAQATDAIVDNIMSPDDFTKEVFALLYEKVDVNNGTQYSDSNAVIIENLRKLSKIYNVERDSKAIIRDALIYGDRFEAILPINKELNKMLSESSSLFESKDLSEEDFIFSEEEKNLFSSLDALNNKSEKENSKTRKDNSKTGKIPKLDSSRESDIKKDLKNIINENFSVVSPSELMSEMNVIAEDFKELPKVNGPDLYMDYVKNKMVYNVKGRGNSRTKSELEKDIIPGSYRMKLDPKYVIKIYDNGVCYGYYYMEPMDVANAISMPKGNNRFFSFNMLQATDVNTGSSYFADPKSRLIVDIFARSLSTKLNKKFIADNPQFKMILFNLLKQRQLFSKRVRITYFSPNEVIHFYNELDPKTGYGLSIYRKILFSAKLYLSVLTCNLMMKLSRSQDRRTFYIETGLDKAAEEDAYQLVRDIKSRDIRMSDLKTVDSIFNLVGRFQDFIIPTTGGDPAIRIESTPGQSAEVEDDLLEYLRKTLISGIGVPPSYTSYSDELEYARSVSMMNGQFLRSIVIKQATLSVPFSDTYRYLYINEFMFKTGLENDNTNIDLNSITVKFPSPASLNITNLTDSLNNAKGLVDTLSDMLVGDPSGENDLKFYLTKSLMKHFLPMVNWKDMEDALTEATANMIDEKQKAKANPSDSSGSSDSNYDSGDNGGFGDNSDSGGDSDLDSGESDEFSDVGDGENPPAAPEEDKSETPESPKEQADSGSEKLGGGSSPVGNERK